MYDKNIKVTYNAFRILLIPFNQLKDPFNDL